MIWRYSSSATVACSCDMETNHRMRSSWSWGAGPACWSPGRRAASGRHWLRAFARRGCTLGLVSRSEDELRELAESLPGDGHEVLPADVGDARLDARRRSRRSASSTCSWPTPGIAHYRHFQELPLEKAEQMTRVNWLGTLYTVDAALPGMIERGRGHVVIVSSGAGFRAFPQASVYGATKAAQRAFADALRHELAGTGVSVTTVFPGEIKSQLHDHEQDTCPPGTTPTTPPTRPSWPKRVVEAVDRDKRR